MAEREDDLPERIDAEDARELAGKGEVRVLDLRPAEQFADSRPAGATHADPGELGPVLESVEHDPRPARFLIVADDDDAGDAACATLREAGHEAATIDGGFKSWVGEGNPVQPRSDDDWEGPDLKQPGA